MSSPRRQLLYFQDILLMLRDPAASDDDVGEALGALVVSYSAPAAASELLAVACLTGRHRPALFGTALERAIGPTFAMGIVTAAQFWPFAEGLIERHASGRCWSDEALDWLRTELPAHGALIARLLAVHEAAWQRELLEQSSHSFEKG